MEEMDLREYWEILVKKKQLILAVFFVTVLAVTIYSLVATPIYEASTTVIVREGGSGAEAILFDGIATLGKNTAQNYIQIMKSRTVLEQVAAELGREELTPTALDKAITIQPIQGSDVLKISMQSPEPTLAQAVVNKLADVFISWNLDYRQNDRKAARLFIESQLETVEQDLRLAEERLQNFKEEQGVLAPAQETTAVVGQLASLHSNLTELAISKQEIDERIRQVRANLAEQDETLISSTTIADNRLVTEYRSRLADLEIKLSSAREKYTERHPEILSLQAEIEDVRRKLTEEVERARHGDQDFEYHLSAIIRYADQLGSGSQCLGCQGSGSAGHHRRTGKGLEPSPRPRTGAGQTYSRCQGFGGAVYPAAH